MLDNIDSPLDLKVLPNESMPSLCSEIRKFLVEKVCMTGGHLASNLGVVELSVALHRVFETPKDHIIFDVGHQSYIHKILTGRKDRFDTLRSPGGISGFPKRDESEHDAFGTGHSSTSLSAALGFAMADKLSGSDAHTVAVLGDGAFTGGMIHEALNNCNKNLKLTIVLNENEMSISKTTGRFADTLAKIRASSGYFKAKRRTKNIVKGIPLIGDSVFNGIVNAKKTVKDALYGSNYFENMGIYYLGPVDGNDYDAVEELLREARDLNQCTVVHIKTQKGKGYLPAEREPALYHGVHPAKNKAPDTTYSKEFGKFLSLLASKDKKICAITAAMSDGTGLEAFRKKHPSRFFDVGIAEEHAVTFSAGLSANGMHPVVAIYSTFLQRSYDNILHDVALQNIPITFCIDRAGLNQSDGATHHGIFDVAFLSHVPNLCIYTPVCYKALRKNLEDAIASDKCCAIRYPSGEESRIIIDEFYGEDYEGSYDSVRTSGIAPGCEGIIVTHGRIAAEAIKAKNILAENGIKIGIILAEKIKPYSELASAVADLLPKKKIKLITLEEEIKAGGFGMMLLDALSVYPVAGNKEKHILATDGSFCVPTEGKSCYETSGISANNIVKLFINNR